MATDIGDGFRNIIVNFCPSLHRDSISLPEPDVAPFACYWCNASNPCTPACLLYSEKQRLRAQLGK